MGGEMTISVAALTIAVGLLQTTLAPGAPAEDPVATTSQVTLITGPQQAPLWRAPNLLTSTLYVSLTDPFRQSEWPNPAPLASLQTFSNTRPSDPPGLPEIRQFDWPNPLLKRTTALTWTNGVVSLADPLRPLDWPIPARTALMAPSWTYARPSYYADPVAETKPFAQTDWVTPGRASSLQVSISSTIVVAETTVPFKPVAWENPTRRASLVGLSWTQAIQCYDNTPFGFIWIAPAPLARQPIVTPPQNLLTTTLGEAPSTPIRPLAWPNPTHAVRPALTWTHPARTDAAADPLRPIA